MRAHRATDAALNAYGERNPELPAGHVMQLRRVVDELVHCQRDEVDEHDLDYRPQSGGRRADGKAHDGALADRRVDHAIYAEFFGQSFGHAERAAESDVFTEDIDRRIAAHFFLEPGADGFEVRLLRHGKFKLTNGRSMLRPYNPCARMIPRRPSFLRRSARAKGTKAQTR